MPINDPNLQHEIPTKRAPNFGSPTMLLLSLGAIVIGGMFIFFAGYGTVNSATQ